MRFGLAAPITVKEQVAIEAGVDAALPAEPEQEKPWAACREKPVQITDEMVDRAALAMTNELRRKVGLAPMTSLDELEPDERKRFSSDVRIALAAALWEEKP